MRAASIHQSCRLTEKLTTSWAVFTSAYLLLFAILRHEVVVRYVVPGVANLDSSIGYKGALHVLTIATENIFGPTPNLAIVSSFCCGYGRIVSKEQHRRMMLEALTFIRWKPQPSSIPGVQ